MTLTLTQQAAQLRKLKQESDALEAKADDARARFKEAELALFHRMEAEEAEGVKHRGTNFVPTSTTYGQVQDRDAFIEWARDHRPELIEPHERKGLVNEFIRECLDNGEPLPPGLGFYTRDYISQRAAAK